MLPLGWLTKIGQNRCAYESYFQLLEDFSKRQGTSQSLIIMRAAWSGEITFQCAKTLYLQAGSR